SSTRSKSKKIASSNDETPNNDLLAAFAPIKQSRSAIPCFKPSNRNIQVNNSAKTIKKNKDISEKVNIVRKETSMVVVEIPTCDYSNTDNNKNHESSSKSFTILTLSTRQFKGDFTMNDKEQERTKRKNSVGPNIMSWLEEMLYKIMQYAKVVYKKVISANKAAAHTENAINKFIKEYKSFGEKNDIDCNNEVVKGSAKKKLSWYTTILIKSCNDLFLADKNPTNNTMKDTIYTALSDEHPNEIKKIESNKDRWLKYWSAVLQSL
ncbi:9762_t:CDS:2, partial [Funneliformis geosporum]